MYIILVGAPGAGKGTQAANIKNELNLVQVASGDLFRQALAKETELGKLAKSYMEKGALVPDEITVRMVLDRLAAPDCKNGAILDGFPRNLEQAQALDEALARQGKTIDRLIYLKVSEDELMKRLSGRWICRNCQVPYHEVDSPPKVQGVCDKCGGELYQRPDDVPGTIKKRLEVYFNETTPLIKYYEKAGKLTEVDGEGPADKVTRRVLAAIREETHSG